MHWCFPDENTEYPGSVLRSLKDHVARVPGLWPIEVANAVLMGERRMRLAPSDVSRFFKLIQVLPIEIDDRTADRAFGEILTIARNYNLTAYDAAYLELAMRDGLPLATLDKKLLAAARSAGVSVIS